MFIAHELVVDAGFGVAQSRLDNLAHRGGLSGASQAAFDGGLAAVIRVGPLGDVPGISKLVRVSFLEPVRRGATMTVPLRWEAIGAAGELFPVLDADLILARDGEDRTRLALAGCYRPPLGWFGAGLDRVIMHRLAMATVRALLRSLADVLASSAPFLGWPTAA
jgi:hypothetical protein